MEEILEQYISENSSPESNVLAKLNRQTWLDVMAPRMISGHIQGKLLEMISMMIRPKYILELGTYTGYSAICLAKGLQQNGKLITLEANDELEDFAKGFFQQTAYSDKIEMIIGEALHIIPKLDCTFDLAFIDADKKEYSEYYQAIIPKISKGGFILADNVLWSGKVVDPTHNNDPDTKAIKQFNETILNDHRVENVILPIRDGINLIRVK